MGKVAGYPLPSGLPFIGDMLEQDQIAFLGGIYDDAQRVDEDGARLRESRCQQSKNALASNGRVVNEW